MIDSCYSSLSNKYPWTLIVFIEDFQSERFYYIRTLDPLISGFIWFQDFCPLIRTVENFHLRHPYSSHPFYLIWNNFHEPLLSGILFLGKSFGTILTPFFTLSYHPIISGHIRFQDFCPLIRAFEKFHPRHF